MPGLLTQAAAGTPEVLRPHEGLRHYLPIPHPHSGAKSESVSHLMHCEVDTFKI